MTTSIDLTQVLKSLLEKASDYSNLLRENPGLQSEEYEKRLNNYINEAWTLILFDASVRAEEGCLIKECPACGSKSFVVLDLTEQDSDLYSYEFNCDGCGALMGMNNVSSEQDIEETRDA